MNSPPSAAPVSPSTPISRPPLMYQTMAFAVPSVVVAIGPVVGLDIGAHQAMVGTGGLPGAMRTATTARSLAPEPDGQIAPRVVDSTT